eukprot:1258824-Prymnesium_polylepis.1
MYAAVQKVLAMPVGSCTTMSKTRWPTASPLPSKAAQATSTLDVTKKRAEAIPRSRSVRFCRRPASWRLSAQ